MTEPHWRPCENCGATGTIEVPDNGTNYGEEACNECGGERGRMEDEFGDEPQ